MSYLSNTKVNTKIHKNKFNYLFLYFTLLYFTFLQIYNLIYNFVNKP